ncbi:MAG: hypothetical protein EXR75_07655 [Myxococcales bacterium]|nr:hypothetical protein [Myxococcales bacterium]
MPKPNPKAIARAAASYLQAHPDELLRALRSVMALRVGIPLAALRYIARELLTGKKAPRDLVIEAVPPGLRISATVRFMGSDLRAKVSVFLESVEVSAEKILLGTRIADLELEALGGDSAIAGLLKSGALDLSKPGNLLAFLPNRPAFIVDAKDDRIVVDVMMMDKLAAREGLRRALAVVTPVLKVASIRTKDDHLDVQLRASLENIGSAVAAARS